MNSVTVRKIPNIFLSIVLYLLYHQEKLKTKEKDKYVLEINCESVCIDNDVHAYESAEQFISDFKHSFCITKNMCKYIDIGREDFNNQPFNIKDNRYIDISQKNNYVKEALEYYISQLKIDNVEPIGENNILLWKEQEKCFRNEIINKEENMKFCRVNDDKHIAVIIDKWLSKKIKINRIWFKFNSSETTNNCPLCIPFDGGLCFNPKFDDYKFACEIDFSKNKAQTYKLEYVSIKDNYTLNKIPLNLQPEEVRILKYIINPDGKPPENKKDLTKKVSKINKKARWIIGTNIIVSERKIPYEIDISIIDVD